MVCMSGMFEPRWCVFGMFEDFYNKVLENNVSKVIIVANKGPWVYYRGHKK